MSTITDEQREHFRDQGYVVVPGVVTDTQFAAARRTVATMLEQQPPTDVGVHFLWPRLKDAPALLDVYREAGISDLAGQLIRSDLVIDEPEQAQVATTIPPWPHRPGGPHVDGLTPMAADGVPGTFTMLAGLWLTDHEQPDRGNLYVWPGSHLGLGAYLAERGADALTRVDEMNDGPYPEIDLDSPVQVSGPAGSILFAHYLLGHNMGGHSGAAGDERRETVYYRLHTSGHRDRWREVVTNPLLEFRR
ncbi:phytanoyl-CoA dioxygenase family protein [Kribbella sp. NPDC050124]|uniref:phytanoyl-CoA dioxygenase family protein n=1 Tax=Kribbella sp. NPDC050124 TaxID=3364114 RepID=UPI0037ADA3CD